MVAIRVYADAVSVLTNRSRHALHPGRAATVFSPRPLAARPPGVLRPDLDRAALRRHAIPLSRRPPAGRGRGPLSAAARGADAGRGAGVGRRLLLVAARPHRRKCHAEAAVGRACRRVPGVRRDPTGKCAAARAARCQGELCVGRQDGRGALHEPRSVRAETLRRQGGGRRHSGGRGGDRRGGRRRAGHAGLSLHGGGDARHGQGPRGAGAGSAQRRSLGALRRRRRAVRRSCVSWRRTRISRSATCS